MAIAQVQVDWTQLTALNEQLEVCLNTLRTTKAYEEDMHDIKEFMLETSKGFIVKNKAIDTTLMLNSMKAEVSNRRIRLWNEAVSQDGRGYPYPRAIEYGHFSVFTGQYKPARPFLRPTLRLASELSKNKLENTTLNVLRGQSLHAQGRRAQLGFGNKLQENKDQGKSGMSQLHSTWKHQGVSVWDNKR